MDWNEIKAEYIAGGTSYRKLAKKHGVSFNTLTGVAMREEWVKLKKQTQNKSTAKIVNTIASDIANNSIKINNVADKLLDKISGMLDETDSLDTQSIKHLTSSLKDIKDVKGVKSEIDLKEQNARIDKLRKEIEADKEHDEKVYGVLLMPPIMSDLEPPIEVEDNE